MNCETARGLLLEAELSELEGAVDTALARHLAVCSQCAEQGRRILASERALAAALDGVRPGQRPRDEHGRPGGAATRAAKRWRRRARVLIPVALAAGIGALVLLDHGTAPIATAPIALEQGEQRLRVDVPPGQNAVLYETDNPDVIVVWFY